MREIVLDTETTGLAPEEGHRIVEIGCVELINHLPSGAVYHQYVNPQRDMPEGARRVHGLTEAFLADKPPFGAIAAAFLDFIADAPLVIHNARFDIGHLNAEFARLGLAALPLERAIDTAELARRRYPGAKASLDDLCRRFEIDASQRTFHGALLDAQLLAEVYLELIGGRQPGLALATRPLAALGLATGAAATRPPRPPRLASAAELAAHRALVAELKDPLWPSG